MRKFLKTTLSLALCLLLCVSAMTVIAEKAEVTAEVNPITGEITVRGIESPETLVGIVARDANGLIIYIGEVMSDQDGNYEATFKPATDIAQGDITIQVEEKTITVPYTDPTAKSGNSFLTFSVEGIAGTISTPTGKNKGTVHVVLPRGSSVKQLAPTFTVSDGAKVMINGEEQISGLTAQNFTEPVQYEVYAENHDVYYYVVAVSVSGENTSGGGGSTGGGASLGGGSTGGGVPIAPVVTQGPFDDIDHVGWAKEGIEALAKANIINGVGNRKFDPDGNITREAMAKIVVLTMGFDASGATNSQFYDVVTGSWYYRYVCELYRQGVMNGYNDEIMGIGQNITRQDLCAMIYRAANVKGITLTPVQAAESFKDQAAISDYARDAVTTLQRAGIINGMGNGNFEPKATATRAQAAKMMYEIYKIVKAK